MIPVRKIFVAGLTLLFAAQNTVLLHAAESNFWQERRQAINQEAKKTDSLAAPLQLASAALANGSLSVPLSPSALTDLGVAHLDHSEMSEKVGRWIPRWVQQSIAPYAVIQNVSLSNQAKAPTILLIQDIHLHKEAQTNIAGVIEALGEQLSLNNKEGKITVGLEGAEGRGDYSRYEKFPLKKELRQAAKAFMEAHVLSGPEMAVIGYSGKEGRSSKLPFGVIGVEKISEYEANVKALKDGVLLKEPAEKALADLKAQLTSLKSIHYTKEQFVFDAKVNAYAEQKISLPEYVMYLDSIASATEKNSRDLIEAALLEGSMDFKKIERERAEMLKNLVAKMSDSAIQDLLKLSALYRAGQVSYTAYFNYLKRTAAQHGVQLTSYPEMNLYIQYVLKSDGIDAGKLFEEIRALEKNAQDAMFASNDSRELAKLTHDSLLLAKLKDHVLTEEEWMTYSEHKEEISALPQRLEKLGAKTPDSIIKMNSQWTTFEAFYTSAMQRNHSMAENLVKAVPDSSVAVLVAGGFHTSGLLKELKKHDAHVLTITPKITSTEDGLSSLDILASGRTPLEQMFVGERLFLTVAQATMANPGATAAATTAAASVAGKPAGTKATVDSESADEGDVTAKVAAQGEPYDVMVDGTPIDLSESNPSSGWKPDPQSFFNINPIIPLIIGFIDSIWFPKRTAADKILALLINEFGVPSSIERAELSRIMDLFSKDDVVARTEAIVALTSFVHRHALVLSRSLFDQIIGDLTSSTKKIVTLTGIHQDFEETESLGIIEKEAMEAIGKQLNLGGLTFRIRFLKDESIRAANLGFFLQDENRPGMFEFIFTEKSWSGAVISLNRQYAGLGRKLNSPDPILAASRLAYVHIYLHELGHIMGLDENDLEKINLGTNFNPDLMEGRLTQAELIKHHLSQLHAAVNSKIAVVAAQGKADEVKNLSAWRDRLNGKNPNAKPVSAQPNSNETNPALTLNADEMKAFLAREQQRGRPGDGHAISGPRMILYFSLYAVLGITTFVLGITSTVLFGWISVGLLVAILMEEFLPGHGFMARLVGFEYGGNMETLTANAMHMLTFIYVPGEKLRNEGGRFNLVRQKNRGHIKAERIFDNQTKQFVNDRTEVYAEEYPVRVALIKIAGPIAFFLGAWFMMAAPLTQEFHSMGLSYWGMVGALALLSFSNREFIGGLSTLFFGWIKPSFVPSENKGSGNSSSPRPGIVDPFILAALAVPTGILFSTFLLANTPSARLWILGAAVLILVTATFVIAIFKRHETFTLTPAADSITEFDDIFAPDLELTLLERVSFRDLKASFSENFLRILAGLINLANRRPAASLPNPPANDDLQRTTDSQGSEEEDLESILIGTQEAWDPSAVPREDFSYDTNAFSVEPNDEDIDAVDTHFQLILNQRHIGVGEEPEDEGQTAYFSNVAKVVLMESNFASPATYPGLVRDRSNLMSEVTFILDEAKKHSGKDRNKFIAKLMFKARQGFMASAIAADILLINQVDVFLADLQWVLDYYKHSPFERQREILNTLADKEIHPVAIVALNEIQRQESESELESPPTKLPFGTYQPQRDENIVEGMLVVMQRQKHIPGLGRQQANSRIMLDFLMWMDLLSKNDNSAEYETIILRRLNGVTPTENVAYQIAEKEIRRQALYPDIPTLEENIKEVLRLYDLLKDKNRFSERIKKTSDNPIAFIASREIQRRENERGGTVAISGQMLLTMIGGMAAAVVFLGLSVPIAIVVLAALIIVHEIGHFAVAEMYGQKLEWAYGKNVFGPKDGFWKTALRAVTHAGEILTFSPENGESNLTLRQQAHMEIAGPVTQLIFGGVLLLVLHNVVGVFGDADASLLWLALAIMSLVNPEFIEAAGKLHLSRLERKSFPLIKPSTQLNPETGAWLTPEGEIVRTFDAARWGRPSTVLIDGLGLAPNSLDLIRYAYKNSPDHFIIRLFSQIINFIRSLVVPVLLRLYPPERRDSGPREGDFLLSKFGLLTFNNGAWSLSQDTPTRFSAETQAMLQRLQILSETPEIEMTNEMRAEAEGLMAEILDRNRLGEQVSDAVARQTSRSNPWLPSNVGWLHELEFTLWVFSRPGVWLALLSMFFDAHRYSPKMRTQKDPFSDPRYLIEAPQSRTFQIIDNPQINPTVLNRAKFFVLRQISNLGRLIFPSNKSNDSSDFKVQVSDARLLLFHQGFLTTVGICLVVLNISVASLFVLYVILFAIPAWREEVDGHKKAAERRGLKMEHQSLLTFNITGKASHYDRALVKIAGPTAYFAWGAALLTLAQIFSPEIYPGLFDIVSPAMAWGVLLLMSFANQEFVSAARDIIKIRQSRPKTKSEYLARALRRYQALNADQKKRVKVPPLVSANKQEFKEWVLAIAAIVPEDPQFARQLFEKITLSPSAIQEELRAEFNQRAIISFMITNSRNTSILDASITRTLDPEYRALFMEAQRIMTRKTQEETEADPSQADTREIDMMNGDTREMPAMKDIHESDTREMPALDVHERETREMPQLDIQPKEQEPADDAMSATQRVLDLWGDLDDNLAEKINQPIRVNYGGANIEIQAQNLRVPARDYSAKEKAELKRELERILNPDVEQGEQVGMVSSIVETMQPATEGKESSLGVFDINDINSVKALIAALQQNPSAQFVCLGSVNQMRSALTALTEKDPDMRTLLENNTTVRNALFANPDLNYLAQDFSGDDITSAIMEFNGKNIRRIYQFSKMSIVSNRDLTLKTSAVDWLMNMPIERIAVTSVSVMVEGQMRILAIIKSQA